MELVEEQEVAHTILSHHVEAWRMGALVDLALQMQLKTFLAHRHCQSLMDSWWRGGYPSSTCVISADEGLAVLSMYISMPMLNPYMRTRASELASLLPYRSREEREQVLFGALARALTQAAKARRAASASAELPHPRHEGAAAARRKPNAREATRRIKMFGVGGAAGLGAVSGRELSDDADDDRVVHFDPAVENHDPHRSRILSRTRTLRALGSKHPAEKNFALASAIEDEKRAAALAADPFSRVRAFYSVPIVKFIARALCHVAFLGLYAEVLTHLHTADQIAQMAPRLPRLTQWEMVFVVWALALSYEHRHRQRRLRGFGLSTAALPFKSSVLLGHAILSIAIALRLLTLLPQPTWDSWGWVSAAQHLCYLAYASLVSVDAVLMCVELFTFMWTNFSFGVVAIIVMEMLVDLSLFLVFAVVLLLGFSAALLGLSETARHDADAPLADAPLMAAPAADAAAAVELDLSAGRGDSARALRMHAAHEEEAGGSLPLIALPVWAMFTDLEMGQLTGIPLALPLMWLYVLLANVVLVNLLIAMFADTYSRIKKNAEVEYHYQRFLHIFE